jgi:hypothetical protein
MNSSLIQYGLLVTIPYKYNMNSSYIQYGLLDCNNSAIIQYKYNMNSSDIQYGLLEVPEETTNRIVTLFVPNNATMFN